MSIPIRQYRITFSSGIVGDWCDCDPTMAIAYTPRTSRIDFRNKPATWEVGKKYRFAGSPDSVHAACIAVSPEGHALIQAEWGTQRNGHGLVARADAQRALYEEVDE